MRKLYSFFTLIVFSSFLLCMDRPNDNQLIYNQLITNIMIENVMYFSHDSICALALVDKKYNKTIQETVEARKSYLKKCGFTDNISMIDAEITWHKHGSAYAVLKQEEPCEEKCILMLGMAYLKNNHKAVSIEDSFLRLFRDGYINRWPNQCRPRFNSKGETYFHTIERVIGLPEHIDYPDKYIVEYSLNVKHSSKMLRCLIDFEDLIEGNLVFLLEFPALLQAFLQSTQVREGLTNLYLKERGRYHRDDKAKMYNIKGVTIPDDFKLFKPYVAFDPMVTAKSFDDLPVLMKNAILDKYAEQQRERIMIERLPKNIIENIGSFIKRSGRDAFRCVSMTCNKNMWSQDELNNAFIIAKGNNDIKK